MRTSNPGIRNLSRYCNGADMVDERQNASGVGVAIKTLLFIGVTIISAALSARFTYLLDGGVIVFALVVAALGAIITGIISSRSVTLVKVTGFIYAACEGFIVGFSCALAIGAGVGGIITAALFSTLITFAVMATLYGFGLIKVGKGLISFLLTAGIGLVLSQLVLFVVALIFPEFYLMLYFDTPLMIIISVIMVLFASAFLVMDLNNVATLVEGGMDKQYEWSAAYGLTVTLIWLFVEFLRLFLILASRAKRK